jgi:hypothetical protein
MNSLCADYHQGFRLPGMFETEEGFYDGTMILDPVKKNPNDLGRFVNVWFDLAIMSNIYATNYVQNAVCLFAGYCATLDPKSAPTNKQLAVTQIPNLVYSPTQLNALTAGKINCLRYKGANKQPAILHDFTTATSASDFSTIMRINIHRLVIDTLAARGDQYVGESTLDGLQETSMQSAMDQDLMNLKTRGYVNNPNVVISTTTAQANLGKTNLYCTYGPADELIQLNAFVGLGQ